MERIQFTEDVPKEIHELNMGLLNLTKAVKQALADGWQPMTDVPVIVMAAIHDLGPAVQGLEKVDDEFGEDMPGAVMSGGWLVSKIIALFKKPKAA